MLGNSDLVFLVSPDKETSVAINLSNPKGKQFVFDGPYATINNEWTQPDLRTQILPIYRDDKMLDSIVGFSPNEFKKHCIDQYQQYVAHNNSQKQFS